MTPRERLDEACITVREYMGSGATKAVIELIDALEVVYFHDLVDADANMVPGIQRSIQQGRALRSVLIGDEYHDARI